MALARQGGYRVAQAAHGHGRIDTPADHIADRQREAGVVLDDVVPIATDVESVGAGLVERSHLVAGHDRESVGEQAALQFRRQGPLGLVVRCPGHRAMDQRGHGLEHRRQTRVGGQLPVPTEPDHGLPSRERDGGQGLEPGGGGIVGSGWELGPNFGR